MQVTEKDVKTKSRVGKLGRAPVIELVCKGGLNLIVAMRNGRAEILGAGPHRAVARFIAQRKESEIIYDDLEKSDPVDEWVIQDLLPEYEALTNEMRARQGL